MRILVTGGEGQLARAIARRAEGHVVIAPARRDLDIVAAPIDVAVAGYEPDVVVNTAALTDVDRCERDPDAAFRTNALGARNAAVAAARAGARFVQISTDYVFDGLLGRPYWEFDAPTPVSVYGASKLAGEEAVRAVCREAFVVRSAWLYGVGGDNFVTRIQALAASGEPLRIVDSEVGSPTYCDDLADALFELMGTTAYGVHHLTNAGACSRYEFACAILEMTGHSDVDVRPVESYERPARRPAYAPLRNFAPAELGIHMPGWRDALGRYLRLHMASEAAGS
jgi:dTDP-4-dehydrorhamnose reductase